MKLDNQSLFVTYSGIKHSFIVTPQKNEDTEEVVFEINMGDNDLKTIRYSYSDGWYQLIGKQIYTDLLHLIGGMIQRCYPELF